MVEPNNADVLYYLALTYEEMKRFEDALREIQRAIASAAAIARTVSASRPCLRTFGQYVGRLLPP